MFLSKTTLSLFLAASATASPLRKLQNNTANGAPTCGGQALLAVSNGCIDAEACAAGAAEMGLQAGNDEYPLEGDWSDKGCYYYPDDHPLYPNQAYFGTGGTCSELRVRPQGGAERVSCDGTTSPPFDPSLCPGNLCVNMEGCRMAAISMNLELGSEEYAFEGNYMYKGCVFFPESDALYPNQAFWGSGASICGQLRADPTDGSLRISCAGIDQEPTPVVEAELPAVNQQPAEPETDAPEPETNAPREVETDAPEPETDAPEPETDAPEPETDVPREVATDAPEPETEMPEETTPEPEPVATEEPVTQPEPVVEDEEVEETDASTAQVPAPPAITPAPAPADMPEPTNATAVDNGFNSNMGNNDTEALEPAFSPADLAEAEAANDLVNSNQNTDKDGSDKNNGDKNSNGDSDKNDKNNDDEDDPAMTISRAQGSEVTSAAAPADALPVLSAIAAAISFMLV